MVVVLTILTVDLTDVPLTIVQPYKIIFETEFSGSRLPLMIAKELQ